MGSMSEPKKAVLTLTLTDDDGNLIDSLTSDPLDLDVAELVPQVVMAELMKLQLELETKLVLNGKGGTVPTGLL